MNTGPKNLSPTNPGPVSPSAISRRDFSLGLAMLLPALAITPARAAEPAKGEGITSNADAIHMERTFKASRQRVYDALTDVTQFNKVVLLSAAMRPGVPPGAPPTVVNAVAGGEFAAFAGYISGRVIELAPPQRIVLAWRTGGWAPGLYSIAHFEFTEAAPNATRLVFDHQGFPRDEAEHLSAGWIANYWEPLEKYLA
jgi:uncharacterized protein YndB with AHSA1/START domain